MARINVENPPVPAAAHRRLISDEKVTTAVPSSGVTPGRTEA